MPVGFTLFGQYGTENVQPGDFSPFYDRVEVQRFVEKKAIKKGAEMTVELIVRRIGIIGSTVADSLFGGELLNGGEDAALAAEDAKLVARQAALDAAKSPLVSPVGESDP